MHYNWEIKGWPTFSYDEQVVQDLLFQFSELTGSIIGIYNNLESSKQQNELIQLLISEAQKTSEIEGELLSREDLMSSIRNQLGLNVNPKIVKDKRAENITWLLLKVQENYSEKLSEKMLKNWHLLLFSGSRHIHAGVYRKGSEAMQIISGSYGKEKVHYEAPPAAQVPAEMKQFVSWYNGFKTNGNMLKAVVKAAIAHLYFESIHPFEDGNGRIGRALIEKCLSESLNRQLLLRISTAIDANKKQYYAALNKASKTLEINYWLVYFAKLLIEAQQQTLNVINLSIKKARFFDTHKNDLNERQLKVLKKVIDQGAEAFEGGMSAKKYMSITKTTKATATRDLQELVKSGLFLPQGDGRSTHYILNW